MTGSTNSGRFAITPARAVEDQRLGDAAYRVLACLGTYADKDGWCWPSTAALAQRLGISRQAVQRSLGQLAALGYIEVERKRRADGGDDRNRYRLLFDRALFEVRNRDVDEAPEAQDTVQHDVAPPCNMTLQSVQRGRGGGVQRGRHFPHTPLYS
jgi:DNA-binding transcriptional MocR family regulator